MKQQQNEFDKEFQELNIINNRRPGRGSLILIEEWDQKKEIPVATLRNWSLLYNFKIIKIGNKRYGYERELERALQIFIEDQERKIDGRRQRS